MTTLNDITINAYQLSLAQQRWVVEHALTAAKAHQNVTLVSAFERAASVVDAALVSEEKYLAERGLRPDGQDAMQLDRSLDALVAVVHRRLGEHADLGDLVSDSRTAAVIRKSLFPKGLRAHTNSPHKAASVKNARVVTVLRDPQWAGVVKALALEPIADRIAELNDAFARVLHPERTIDGDSMDAIRTLSLDATFRAFHMAAALFDPADAAQVAQREDVFRPLLAMQAEVALVHKRRRKGNQVEPEAAMPEAFDGTAPVESTDGLEADGVPDGVTSPLAPDDEMVATDEVLPAELGEMPVGGEASETCAEEAFVTPPNGAGEASEEVAEAVGEEVPADGAGEVAAAAK